MDRHDRALIALGIAISNATHLIAASTTQLQNISDFMREEMPMAPEANERQAHAIGQVIETLRSVHTAVHVAAKGLA